MCLSIKRGYPSSSSRPNQPTILQTYPGPGVAAPEEDTRRARTGRQGDMGLGRPGKDLEDLGCSIPSVGRVDSMVVAVDLVEDSILVVPGDRVMESLHKQVWVDTGEHRMAEVDLLAYLTWLRPGDMRTRVVDRTDGGI